MGLRVWPGWWMGDRLFLCPISRIIALDSAYDLGSHVFLAQYDTRHNLHLGEQALNPTAKCWWLPPLAPLQYQWVILSGRSYCSLQGSQQGKNDCWLFSSSSTVYRMPWRYRKLTSREELSRWLLTLPFLATVNTAQFISHVHTQE